MQDKQKTGGLPGKVFSLLLLLLIPAALLLGGGSGTSLDLSVQSLMESGFFNQLEQYVQRILPMRAELEQLQLQLRLFSGQKEQGGIFICGDRLLKQIDPPIDWYVRKNTEVVRSFSRELGVNTFLALIPTASTISQEKLPPYAHAQMYNQKQFIEDVYNELSGRVTMVDVYTALFNRRDEYLYMRTENNLTAFGGYYTYTALGNKLGIENRSLSQFDIRYIGDGYLGDLYRLLPYHAVLPDTFPLFNYVSGAREYTVTHTRSDGVAVYHTLYPLHLLALGRGEDIYLGGVSSIVDVRTSSPAKMELPSLLVLGDRTALPCLPFLANHYQQVTFLDLFQFTEAQYAAIFPDEYAQVLFCYSVETFMYTDIPLRAERFMQS